MKILILTNSTSGLYNFRYELIDKMLEKEYKIIIGAPYGEKIEFFIEQGCVFYDTKLDRRGTNVIKDLKLLFTYFNILKKEKPDFVLSYTIKPNIYGSIAAMVKNVPYIVNITGLGSAIQNSGILRNVSIQLYKIALKRAVYVFFQNQENMDFFRNANIRKRDCELLPGSGVNLKKNVFQKYPETGTSFAFVGRLMREKGIEEYLYAAEKLKKKYPYVEFHICGNCEEGYGERVEKLYQKGIVIYHGEVGDMREIYREMSGVVLPSYHEGMSNVLLETAATGRIGIASDISGCKEIIEHEKTGFLFEKENRNQLCDMLERIINMPYQEREAMGLAARKKVERDFDRNIIIEKYLDVIGEFSK